MATGDSSLAPQTCTSSCLPDLCTQRDATQCIPNSTCLLPLQANPPHTSTMLPCGMLQLNEYPPRGRFFMPVCLKPETQASSLNSSLSLIISFCGSYLIQLSRKCSLLPMPPTIILAQDAAPSPGLQQQCCHQFSCFLSKPFSKTRAKCNTQNAIMGVSLLLLKDK